LQILPISTTISIVSTTVNYGGTANLEIAIANQEPFVAFQFDLHFPEGITINTSNVVLTNRKSDHTISASLISSTVLRVISFSMTQQPFSGSSGAVVVIPLQTNTLLPNVYDLALQSVTITNANSQNIPANIVNGNLTIQKIQQTIDVPLSIVKIYGDANFTLPATASSGLPISYTSGNNNIATVSGNTVTIVGAGQTTLFASQGGNAIYLPAETKETTLQIAKANLTITANDATRLAGEPNPTFTMSFEGFQYTDTEADIDELPQISCNADENSPAGNYEIYLTGGNDNNYEFTLISGTLIVGPVGIDDLQVTNYDLRVYPNPTTGELRIENEELRIKRIENGELRIENEELRIKRIEIYDIEGRKQKIIVNYQLSIINSINISHLPAGVYCLNIIFDNNYLVTKKIIKL